MATITKSIGATGRDYSTVTLWEADLDNGAVYAASDTAVGEMYNDSTFVESPTINGGGTIVLAGIVLQPATGQGHTGTANGAVIQGTLTCGGGTGRSHNLIGLRLTAGRYANIGITSVVTMRRCIGHNTNNTSTGIVSSMFTGNNGGATGSGAGPRFLNCIGWKFAQTGGGSRSAYMFGLAEGTRYGQAWNCTAWGLTGNGTGVVANFLGNSANSMAKNCIGMGAASTGGGAVTDFLTPLTQEYNMSEDATAAGTGSLTSKVVANQFVSTAGGSEDLHLKAGADAINAGNDYATTPTNVQFDIDNYDRDTTGVTWDIGADEYVSAGGSTQPPRTMHQFRMR
jgi:hypothetical protein